MEEAGKDEMDSLFEGMVLFTPDSQLDADQDVQHIDNHRDDDDDGGDSAPGADGSPTLTTTSYSYSSSQPLDENLFSDLTLVSPATCTNTTASTASPTVSRQISKKKKRTGSLRIGYGRDAYARSLDVDVDEAHPNTSLPVPENFGVDACPSTPTTTIVPPSNESDESMVYSLTKGNKEDDYFEDDKTGSPSQRRLDQIKALICEKLNRARQLVSSVSEARKGFIARRRKAAENLSSASITYADLERQLDEACEAEDFDAAERLSESLAAADKEKQFLAAALRDTEAEFDAIDIKMQEALDSQIAAEEECASLLGQFATDASSEAEVVVSRAEVVSSKQMDQWLSSTEALEIKKMELEIESQIINEASTMLNNTIELSVEDDKRERESLCKKKDALMNELKSLLTLVKQKEEEIAKNDADIKAVDKRIGDVVSGFQEMQSSIDAKFVNLQSGLSHAGLDSNILLLKKKEIDEFLSQEEHRGAKLKELAKAAAEEAKTYQEAVGFRKSLMLSVSKSREDKARLAKTEEKLSKDVKMLQLEVSASRASLQELSSRKSSIQQGIATSKQKILFIDKRAPELEAEKKVAASARNFKEAARIAAEAKSLTVEKDGIQIDMGRAVLELEKLEEGIKDTVNKLQDYEGLIVSKEREVAMARFERLLLIAGSAAAERTAALEFGDLEEANLLLVEAEAANVEAKALQPLYNFDVGDFVNLPKHFISMDLVANLGRKQLAELAASINFSPPS
ncbi:hypothetical protein FNV43_RR12147 [Rhamnella rubrinervis]|uniref:UVR domain-containing protein n=1 Tax=Rhamnella rubrinervis TaxID=2594499 RepID=A0A8K0H6Z9_9ROSA|nr:hypothetical protein FNV43_RR12147 [Rhamnella rubrinervis]